MHLDVSTCPRVKVKSRPPKLKIWPLNLDGNHVKSIPTKYELNPTANKDIFGDCGSKIMIFLILMHLDVSTCPRVKVKSRPPKLKIWPLNLVGNHVKSIPTKYELNPTEDKYIFGDCRPKNHVIFWLWWNWWFRTSRLANGKNLI